ncbi:hypothetical protein HBI60_227980 [Parastagonospora nodorum]|nr:hypothetical protein HBH82_230900 [Parastagonospora nodorum]KAH4661483.1 hypothetical protein HBH78_222930 [Parastagonospora nodorum]KAH4691681.1 hypothetical protein HBH67_239140 [Parastagonospora nodorum]KAH4755713.1 hypothetical protein HBH63_230590 [Parastagonospora nodorum]KAH4769743.1 hypothetical protein HBH62_228370 [Parastagonospora nodorum]
MELCRNHRTMGKFPFLTLPPEVRVAIYKFAMAETTEPITMDGTTLRYDRITLPLSLGLTCRQIHNEARYELYLKHRRPRVPVALTFDMSNAQPSTLRRFPAWFAIACTLRGLDFQIASDQRRSVANPRAPVKITTPYLSAKTPSRAVPLGSKLDRILGISRAPAFKRFLSYTVLQARHNKTIQLRLKASKNTWSDFVFLADLAKAVGPHLDFSITVFVPEGPFEEVWRTAMDLKNVHIVPTTWEYRGRVQITAVEAPIEESPIWRLELPSVMPAVMLELFLCILLIMLP